MRERNNTATDYDHEIPGVVVDTDPRVDGLKAAFFEKARTLITGGLVTSEQIAETVATAESIKHLAKASASPVKNHISRSLLETCGNFRSLDMTSADRAYDEFRTDFLIGLKARVPHFETGLKDSGIRARIRTTRSQTFKFL